jgi:pimeloyl-ACP methyl ester carboxylesterase
MLQPPGFCQTSLSTPLGTLVYYQPDNYQPDSYQPDSNQPQGSTHPDLAPSNRPPLVFLHGFGGGSSAYEWSLVYPAFVPQYQVVAPDLIGWGRSAHLSRSYQIQDYLSSITDFLEQVCLGPAVVVASSLTAALAIRVAVTRPQLFQGLILVTPSGLADFDQPYSNFFAQLVSTPGLDRLVYSTAIATGFGIRNFLETRQFARASRVTQEMVDAYLASAQQPNADYSALSFVRGDLCFDLAAYMPQITVPTTVLWGQQAQFTPVDLGQRLVELNPQAIKLFTVLEDAGLTPQLELPGVTAGWIYRSLELLSGCV